MKRKCMGSLTKAFEVLKAVVSCQDTGIGFAEVVSRTGLPKASVHRILRELNVIGYLTYNPDTKKYRGSLKLANLGSEVMANFDLRDHVHPHLLELRRVTDHTCHMAIRDGDVGVYVDKVESHYYKIKLFSEVGKSFYLHCTGLGKVLLAWSDPGDVKAILARPLKPLTDRTITDPDRLLEELEIVREQGYAVDREEITRGIMCVAAPVFGVHGDCIAAVSTTFPSYLNEERGIGPEREAVLDCALAISGNLSGRDSSVARAKSTRVER
jgi:IclR family KDG regulon transcriptional repressor